MMLSVLRPTMPSTSFFVDDTLQAKIRSKRASSLVIPSASASQLLASRTTALVPVASSCSVTSLSGNFVKRHPFQEYTKNMMDFFRLLETNLITDFLACDKCYHVSDNYALSMVFIYFIRADFAPIEYTKDNFFVALYLALDMEDDVDDFKFELFPWCLGKDWKRTYPRFLQCRDRLWMRMNYRALCSKATCDEIMRILPSPHWTRFRKEDHGGAIRKHRLPAHPSNDLPVGPFGTPVPCFHCFLIKKGEAGKVEDAEQKERDGWTRIKTKSPGSTGSKTEDGSDIFVTADEGDGIDRYFAPVKQEIDSSFLSLSSSGYRDASAFGDDHCDDDDEIFWNDVPGATSKDKDIFAPSSDEEEDGDQNEETAFRDTISSGGDLSDIFASSSDETADPVGRVRRGVQRAHRSISRINLRDSEGSCKDISPLRGVFLAED